MAETVHGFGERDVGRIARVVQRVERDGPPPPLARRRGAPLARPPVIQYGKAAAAWDSATPNEITLDPCTDEGTDIADEENVTCHVTWPLAAAPDRVEIAKDDVLAYVTFWDNQDDAVRGILVGFQNLGTHAVEYDSLPAGGSIETETAQTDTWDRSIQPEGKDGIKLRVCTRIAYNEAGDQTLYEFTRILTYDSTGKLAAMSAETRTTIDVPEACG